MAVAEVAAALVWLNLFRLGVRRHQHEHLLWGAMRGSRRRPDRNSTTITSAFSFVSPVKAALFYAAGVEG